MRAWWAACLVASTSLADDWIPDPPPESPVVEPPESPVVEPIAAPPSPPPPPRPPPPRLVHDGYPRAIAQRPLVLPRGVIEIGGQALRNETELPFGESIDVSIGEGRLRYGIGGVDFELAGQLVLSESAPEGFDIDFPKYRAGSFAVRVALPRSLAVGARLGKLDDIRKVDEVGETTRWQPRLVVAAKHPLHATSALEITGFVGRDWLSQRTFRGTTEETYTWVAGADVRVQGQLSPVIAIEGRATLAIQRQGMTEVAAENDAMVSSYGGRVIAVVTPKIDLHVGFDLLHSGDESNTTQWSAGFATRLP